MTWCEVKEEGGEGRRREEKGKHSYNLPYLTAKRDKGVLTLYAVRTAVRTLMFLFNFQFFGNIN